MRSLCIAVLGVLLSGAVYAQDRPLPARLSLDEALRLAEARNPQIVVSQQAVLGAEADVVTAGKRPNPAFAFTSEGYAPSQPVAAPFFDSQELTLTVQQELETGGRRGLRTEQGRRGVASSRASARDVTRQLLLDVRRSFLLVVLAKADDEVALTTL